MELGLWEGARSPGGSPRGPGRGLGVPWEALGESQGGFSDTRRSLWGPRGVRLNFRGGLGGSQGGNGKSGVVFGGSFWSTGRTQNINKTIYFMCIFAMGEFLEGPLNGPKNSKMYPEGQRGPRGNGRGA